MSSCVFCAIAAGEKTRPAHRGRRRAHRGIPRCPPGVQRALGPPGGNARVAALLGAWRATRHLGDNAAMARDDGMAQLQQLALLRMLDGARPSEALEWVSPVAPAVTQAAVGAYHWAAGRMAGVGRGPALLASAGAGLGAEAICAALAQQLLLFHVYQRRQYAGPRGQRPPPAPGGPVAVVGAGHSAAEGARRRALAAWAGAAGFGLVAWGLGAEAPTRAEADKNMEEQKELLRQRGAQVPATVGTLNRSQPAIAARPGRRWVLGADGLRRAVGPAPAAAAEGARDRSAKPRPSCSTPLRVLPGRAAAQAEDRRRFSPGRSRIEQLARLRAASAKPLR